MMKVTIVRALVLLMVMYGVLGTSINLKLKVKNRFTNKEQDEEIDVDTNKGTEVIKAEGETSMKDINTGYTAIKSADNQECLIFKNDDVDDEEEKQTPEQLKEALETIKKSGKKPEVVEEAALGVKTTRELTAENREEIGQNLIEFCDNATMLLGSSKNEGGVEEGAKPGPVGEEQEVEEENRKGKSDNKGKSRPKRHMPMMSSICQKVLYRRSVCIRRLYRMLYCCHRSWLGYCNVYCNEYYYRYTCYNQYFYVTECDDDSMF